MGHLIHGEGTLALQAGLTLICFMLLPIQGGEANNMALSEWVLLRSHMEVMKKETADNSALTRSMIKNRKWVESWVSQLTSIYEML